MFRCLCCLFLALIECVFISAQVFCVLFYIINVFRRHNGITLWYRLTLLSVCYDIEIVAHSPQGINNFLFYYSMLYAYIWINICFFLIRNIENMNLYLTRVVGILHVHIID